MTPTPSNFRDLTARLPELRQLQSTAHVRGIYPRTLLLGTYLRLKELGVTPIWAADHGVGTSVYYEDPEKNVVEIQTNNYDSRWTQTEHLRNMTAQLTPINLDKVVEARAAGATHWEIHERAFAREFMPNTFNPPRF